MDVANVSLRLTTADVRRPVSSVADQFYIKGRFIIEPAVAFHRIRVMGDRKGRILLVHDNVSFRDLIRELGVPAGAHVVPAQPVLPSRDELAPVASSHDLTVIGPSMGVEDVGAVFVAGH